MLYFVRHSFYVVSNEGQKIWHGIFDWNYPWLAEFDHG